MSLSPLVPLWLLFKNKINRKYQKDKTNDMIHAERFSFEYHKGKYGKDHQRDDLLNYF